MKKWLSFLLFLPSVSFARTHPSLLNTQADWTAMIASSTIHPWSDVVSGATMYLSGPQATGVNAYNCTRMSSHFGSGSDAVRQQNANGFMNLMGSYALEYVLHSADSSSATYRNDITCLMDVWPAMVTDQPVSDDYNLSVPYNGAFVSMVIAYDNIYNDLSAVQISSYNVMLDSWTAYNRATIEPASSWVMSPHGAEAVWSIFRDTDSTQIAADTACYHVDLLGNEQIYPPAICGNRQAYHNLSSEVSVSQLNRNGVSMSGPTYAWARVGGESREKEAKWISKDIINFTGMDTTYNQTPSFSNRPLLSQFYDWLFTFTITPWNTKTAFGDTANNQSSGADNFQGLATLYGHNIYLLSNAWLSAGKYSSYAESIAQSAAKRINDPVIYPGELVDYLSITSSVTASILPTKSLVIPFGGAAFWDENTSSQTLEGVLNNAHITRSDHYHLYDFNGLFLAAYGVEMLSNPGNGASTQGGVGGLNRNQTQCWARFGNVLLMGNTNYANSPEGVNYGGASGQTCNSFWNWNPFVTGTQNGQYVGNGPVTPLYGGDGITESLVSTKFDYAVGLATGPYVYFDTTTGVATQFLGQNQRSFIFVHSDTSTSVNGYWAVDDEVISASYTSVNQIWHPYGQNVTTRSSNKEYDWDIFPQEQASTNTLTVFLASPPSAVSFSSSAFADNNSSLTATNGLYYQANYLNGQYAVHLSSAHILTILYPSDRSGHNKSTFTRTANGEAEGATVLSGNTTDYFMASNGTSTVMMGTATFLGKLAFMRQNVTTQQFFVRQGTSFNDGSGTRYGFDSSPPVSIHLNGTTGSITSTAAATVTLYGSAFGGAALDGLTQSGTRGTNSFTFSVAAGSHTLSVLTTIDPLDTSFLPAIDKTASHYATSFGTVTVSDSLIKVFQSSQTDATNAHWYVGYQMQNEIQSIQVHIDPTFNAPNVNVTMSNLVTTGPFTATISSASTDIEIYKEHYVHVATPSARGISTYYGQSEVYVPDVLIPKVDPYWGQDTGAFPMAIVSTETRSAWIDIHTSSFTPSGYYSGNIYVSSGGVVVSTLPVIVGVWSWSMPSTATLIMMGGEFSNNGMCAVISGGTTFDNTNCGHIYPNDNGFRSTGNQMASVDGDYQLLDNRYNAYETDLEALPGSGDFSKYLGFFTKLYNGQPTHFPVILKGAQPNVINLNIASGQFTSAVWTNFVSTFTQQGWLPKLAYKLCDEPPNGCTWAQLVSSGTATRAFSTPQVPNIVTAEIKDIRTNSAVGQVDWAIPIVNHVQNSHDGSNSRPQYDTWLTESSGPVRLAGSYNDCESAETCGGTVGTDSRDTFPNRHVDGLPIPNRIMETWLWQSSFTAELYYSVNQCDVSPSICHSNSPWNGMWAFGSNGDGTLILASTRPYVITSTPIWVPTMRLKYFRDGEQDYEYEYYLSTGGYFTFVSTWVATAIANDYTYSTDPGPLRAMRLALGNQIHQLNLPTGSTPPPSAPVITSAGSTSGTVGVSFSYSITATNSPTSFDAPGLPTGLSVNTGTGLISGTPVAVQVATVTISATNAGGTGTLALTITINSAPPPPPPLSPGASESLQGTITINGKVKMQ